MKKGISKRIPKNEETKGELMEQWLKKGWKKLVVGFIIVSAIVTFALFISSSQQLQLLFSKHLLPPKVVVVEDEDRKEVFEKVLRKWVYERSSKISAETAKVIVSEVMKTNRPLLLIALIEVESNFVPTAVSSKGAVGLTQVMFEVHQKALIKNEIVKEKRDLFDIEPSIRAGNFVLGTYLNQAKSDVPKALELYLGGKDGAYLKGILSNLANLYILTR